MRWCVVLLLLAALLCTTYGCDLRCFLSRLRIALPPFSYHGKVGPVPFAVTLQDGSCADFQIFSFSSRFDGNVTVETGLSGVGFNCSADFALQLGNLPPIAHGTFVAGENSASFSLSTRLINNASSGLAELVELQACNASISVVFDFDGHPITQDPGLHNAIDALVADAICVAFSFVDDVLLTSFARWSNSELVAYLNPAPPVLPAVPLGVDLVRMPENAFVGLVDFILERLLGPSNFNHVLNVLNVSSVTIPISNGANGTVVVDVAPNVTVAARVNDVRISGNFASWNAFAFAPASEFEVGFVAALLGPVSFDVGFAYNVTVNDDEFDAEGIVRLTVSNLTAKLRAAIFANQSFYDVLTFAQLIDGTCPLVGVLQLNVTQLLANVLLDRFELVSTAINGTLEREFDEMVGNIFALIVSNYAPFVSPLINSFLDTTVRQALQAELDKGWASLNLTFNESCAPSSKSPFNLNMSTVDLDHFELNWFAVFVSGIVFGVLLVGAEAYAVIYSCLGKGTALAFSPSVGWVWRIVVPVLVLFCCAYQAAGWFSMSAILVLRLAFGGGKVMISPTLYEIDLTISIQQAWQAGVYANAFIISFTQVVMPVTLLFTLLATWYLPERVVSKRRRTQWLTVFSSFNRFQLISGFMLVVYQFGFHFMISDERKPPSTLETFIVVSTDFWLFMGCCCLALLACQFQLHWARKEASYVIKTTRDSSKLAFWGVLLSLVVNCGALVAGVILPSYVLEFRGLGGYALSQIGVPQDRTFSMIDTALQMREGWMDTHSSGAYILQVSFFILAIVAPLAQMLSCFVAWIFPRPFTFMLLETCSVWASLDVFVLAILASVLALTEYTSFMLGNQCNLINAILVKYFQSVLDDPICIDVTSQLLPGIFVLVGACGLLAFNSRLILYRQIEVQEKDALLLINADVYQ